MPRVEEVKSILTTISEKLSRIEEFVVNFDIAKSSVSRLKARQQILEGIRKEFEETQYEYETLDSKSDQIKNEHRERRISFENKYCDIMADMMDIIETNHNSASHTGTNSISLVEPTSTLNLPVINLPPFSGNYKDWSNFENCFKSVIDENKSLNNRQKLQYLKTSLREQALGAIESLTISEENYKRAWEILENRFKNTRLIVEDHVKSILNIAPINKQSYGSLRQLSNILITNIEALKSLKIPVESWDALLIPIVADKLDYNTKREWQTSLDTKIPTYEQFVKYLERRCMVVESLGSMHNKPVQQTFSNSQRSEQNRRTVTLAAIKSKSQLCNYCKKSDHAINQCLEFSNLAIQERNEVARSMKLCLNCLRNNHMTNSCRSTTKCRHCNKNHNTLLHKNEDIHTDTRAETASVTLNNHSSLASQASTVILATAMVQVKNAKNQYKSCRLFLDPGSMSNCITKNTCKKLGLQLSNENIQIKGINGTTSTTNKCVHVDIKSNCNGYAINSVKCIVVDKITEHLPLISLNPYTLEIPSNIQLADPKFYQSGEIDLLLGAELFWDLLCIGQISLPSALVLQKTQFGFIASGPYHNNNRNFQSKSVNNTTSCNLSVMTGIHDNLEEKVCKFWEIENAGIEAHNKHGLSDEEIQCVNHFMTNTKRDTDGRFIVKLPIKNKIDIGESIGIATKRFYNTERKLSRDSELKLEYTEFIHEYISLKHMKLVKSIPINENVVYLPHHAVVKESSTTTRLRVVFDASAKTTNNRSLNDNLMCGPTIQRDLFGIILEFRTFKYALNADIAKMYRQILIHPEHRHLQLVLWRDEVNAPLKTYELTTLTYGTKPASFIATQCLKELADINSAKSPEACKFIKNNFYMDDLLAGANSISKLQKIRDEITHILEQGQFKLRKFLSNDEKVLPENGNCPNLTVQLNKNDNAKILGLVWNPRNDTLNYEFNFQESPRKVTKRIILSTTSQIFDPLGLLGPVIMKAKVLLQQLWSYKLGWDESVPVSIYSKWTDMLTDMQHIGNIQIPRTVITFNTNNAIELHAFCDASQVGYGAAIYLRSINDVGEYETNLVCAKSRVAPLKTITLPRLELCGALLLARLVTKVKDNISLKISKQYLWTDSTIVIAWINTPPNTLKTFVSNRVSEIITLTTPNDWRHVDSKNNAADILSRGSLLSDLINEKTWFNGPEFLKGNEQQWPKSKINNNKIEIIESRIPTVISHINIDNPFLKKFSRFRTLQRVTAWILRFIKNCKSTDRNKNQELSTEELEIASRSIVRIVQIAEFSNERSLLNAKKPLPNNSKLIQLSPFIDDSNLLRVGGRLKNAAIGNDVKYPLLLPKNHHVTKLIIQQVHGQQLHAGPQATLAALRQRYWIISARSIIRQVLHYCIKCFKTKPIMAEIKMGNLPMQRVQPARPFSATGIDYAGPVLVRETRGRGKKLFKAYIALFVCFATKAVHIELVFNLTTEEFLGALRRFLSRRGHPCDLYSDNGTNFVGAKNELNELFSFLKQQTIQKQIHNQLTEVGINWHFIPAKSPHMGGLWEANIRSMKTHIKKVVGNAHLTYSEMTTLLVRIEACMNSRPLTPLTSDPNDLQVLTPAHFLIGETLNTFPERNIDDDVPINRLKRWEHVERMRSHFWKRWSREYLTSMQRRTKWFKETPAEADLKGSMVLLVEDNLQPLLWRVGRIIETHPGNDGQVRVVTVKTDQGVTKRSLKKVCPLPIEK